MARLIILIAVAGITLILWYKIKKTAGDERKKLIFWSIIGGILTILALLAVTGHLNIITAMFAGLLALAPRVMSLAKYLPFLSRFYKQNQQANDSTQAPPPNAKKGMSADEAMEVLGLKAGFTKEDVTLAHRRMMQKVHPDRGGSDYLAAQINKAKDTLLS